MKAADLQQMLIDIVQEIQTISGRESANLEEHTRPLDEVPGFDSLNGVEATIEALHRMNLDADFNNVFIADGKSLTFGEAAARLSALSATAD